MERSIPHITRTGIPRLYLCIVVAVPKHDHVSSVSITGLFGSQDTNSTDGSANGSANGPTNDRTTGPTNGRHGFMDSERFGPFRELDSMTTAGAQRKAYAEDGKN